MMTEISTTPQLSPIVSQCLDNISAFKIDTTIPQAHPDNTRRQVLRTLFQPMVFYLVDNGHTFAGESVSPEAILNTIIERPELQLDERIIREIREKYKQPSTAEPVMDWLQESMKITLTGNAHPIERLSQIVTGKLSEKARQELATMGLTG